LHKLLKIPRSGMLLLLIATRLTPPHLESLFRCSAPKAYPDWPPTQNYNLLLLMLPTPIPCILFPRYSLLFPTLHIRRTLFIIHLPTPLEWMLLQVNSSVFFVHWSFWTSGDMLSICICMYTYMNES
jgi:hypothetical protein